MNQKGLVILFCMHFGLLSQPVSLRDSAQLKSEFKEKKENLDVRIFRSINNSRSKLKDSFLNITDRSVLLVSLFTPLSQFVVSSYTENYYDQNSAILYATSQILNFTLTFTTKMIIKRKRPYNVLNNVYIRKSRTDDKYSFPSGHTSSAFAGATSYLLRYPDYPQIYLPVYLYAITIAYGRPYWGMHYPSDILAGAIYGTGSAVIVYSLRKPIIKLKKNIINDNHNDDKSSGGANAFYFLGSFTASVIINEFVFKDNARIRLNTTLEDSGLLINVSVGF